VEGNAPKTDPDAMNRRATITSCAVLVYPSFAALLFAASVLPTPTPFDASKIDYSQFSDEEIAKTAAHRDALKAAVKENVNKVTDVAVSQGSSITDIKKAGDDATKAFKDYQDATEAQITKGNQAIAALAHVLKQLHLAKLIANVLVVVIAGFIALKVPPPIGLYAAGAFAVAGSAAVWFWL
jgi:ABC-type multidrug transport system fused ATPase/permease subunit